jgi:dual specificity tyrosine-phosphorylation-regulated kinase 2/3/4
VFYKAVKDKLFFFVLNKIFFLFQGRSKRGKHRGPPGSKDLSQALKNCDDPLFIDFLKRCLEWDPQTRITPAQALR